MIPPVITLLHGILICIPFSVFALTTFWINPRLWLHSLPPDIIEKANPKTLREKSLTKYLLLPIYLLILPGLSVLSTLWVINLSEETSSLAGILIHLYGIWILVHLWDFLMLDCVTILFMDSNKPPIDGTAGAKGWRDVAFHFKSFIKASLLSSMFVLPASVIIWIANNMNSV